MEQMLNCREVEIVGYNPFCTLDKISIKIGVVILLACGLARPGDQPCDRPQYDLERVLNNTPKDESANLCLGEILFSQKKYALALDHFDKAPTYVSRNPQAILHYAQSALRQGGRKRAVTVLGMLSSQDGEIHFQAGKMLVEEKAYAEAAAQFGMASRTYKDPYLAGYNQALAYVNAGDFPAASPKKPIMPCGLRHASILRTKIAMSISAPFVSISRVLPRDLRSQTSAFPTCPNPSAFTSNAASYGR
jgi:hypothetical protein